jgi:hypothetical protein
MLKKLTLIFFLAISINLSGQYISELEYDVPGTDVAGSEYLEVFYPTGVNQADFIIIRINGATASSGVVYTTSAFSTINCTASTTPAGQICVYTGAQDCLQNGANDAVILFNTVTSTVVQAIAYEGNVTVSNSASPAEIQGLVITSVGSDPGSAASTSLRDDDGDGTFALITSNQGELPIELSNIAVHVKDVVSLLSFTTTTEKNNAYFAIERSSDGRAFTQIGEVKGAGTSLVQQDYTYTDEKPLRGINFYRLKQVDFDGQFSYSPVVSVVFGKVGNVVLYPTPTTSTMNVRLEEAFQTEANWQVIDLMGRVVTEGIFPAEQTDMQIPVGTLSEGNYVLRVTAGQEVITQKFRKIEQ